MKRFKDFINEKFKDLLQPKPEDDIIDKIKKYPDLIQSTLIHIYDLPENLLPESILKIENFINNNETPNKINSIRELIIKELIIKCIIDTINVINRKLIGIINAEIIIKFHKDKNGNRLEDTIYQAKLDGLLVGIFNDDNSEIDNYMVDYDTLSFDHIIELYYIIIHKLYYIVKDMGNFNI